MADSKIIAVVGSTGAQGGSLVEAILNDPNGGFAARAITRDRTSDKARAIAAKGAEVVQADLDDVESLRKAFAGAYGVYAVTNFWEHFSGEKEKAQAKNIADAAEAAGVSHVIWSTLEDTRKLMKADDRRMPMLQEKYRVPHFDAKAEANAYFKGLPTTFLVTSFYWDNLYSFGLAPKKGADGRYEWTFPMGDSKLAGMAAEDIGKSAYGIFKAGQQYVGKTVGIVERKPDTRRDGREAFEGHGRRRRFGTTPSTRTRTAASGFPVPTRWATCSRCTATSKTKSPRRAARTPRGDSIRRLQNFDQFIAKNKSKIASAMNPAPAA